MYEVAKVIAFWVMVVFGLMSCLSVVLAMIVHKEQMREDRVQNLESSDGR